MGSRSGTTGETSTAVAATGPISPAEKGRSITDYRIKPVRRPGRWVGTALVALLVLAVAWSFATNPRWGWDVVAAWLFAESILVGLFNTLELTLIAGVIGFVLGFVLALMRLSSSPLLSGVSWTFSWIFRSTPLLVQLLLWYNIGYLYERITLHVPFTGITVVDAETSTLITPFLAAILGLGLHQAAYSAEIIRGGILSVDQGQLEAAAALGIPARDRQLRIVLPQAMRAALPASFNEIISLVKGTAIVYVLAYQELFLTVQVIYARTQEVLPMLLVATIWYIVITSLLSIAQYYVERRFARGATRELPPTPWQRLKKKFTSVPAEASPTKQADAASRGAGTGPGAGTNPQETSL